MLDEAVNAYGYQIFGLSLRSDLELPELLTGQFDAGPDVAITLGSVSGDAQPGLHADEDGLVLTVPEVARYRIREGREIIVELVPDVPARNVRLFLLGSAFGALLHQRGLLPLHANAIEIDGKAYAFMGQSGAGKSTLAAWFHDKGYPVIADDVCVVAFDQHGRAWACPGLPRLRLWDETLQARGLEPSAYPLSYEGNSELRKYDVSLDAVAQERVELAGVFLLEEGDAFAATPLTGVKAADAIFANTYRGRYLAQVNGHERHWSDCMALLRSASIYRLERAWGLDRLDEQGEAILAFVSRDFG